MSGAKAAGAPTVNINIPSENKRRKKKGKGPKKGAVTVQLVKPMSRKNQRGKKRNNKIGRVKVNDAEAHVKGLVTSLLGTFDIVNGSTHVGEGIRVPRINSRPVAARKIPFSLKIPISDIANNKLQVRFIPDPYRLLAHTVDTGSNQPVQVQSTGLWEDLDFDMPAEFVVCLAGDISDGSGHIVKFDKAKIADGVKYNTPTRGNQSFDPDSAAVLEFESIDINPNIPWTPKVTSYSASRVNVSCTLKAVGADGAGGRTVYHEISSDEIGTTPSNPEQLSMAFVPADFANFAADVSDDVRVKALLVSFYLRADNVSAIESSLVVGLDWEAAKPTLVSPARWRQYSIFDLLGDAGKVLSDEIATVSKGACTQANLRFTDFVAELNKNGTISATQVPASSLKYFPSNVERCIEAIDNLGIPEYSWKSHPEPKGLSYVTHFDNPSEWERKPSKYLTSLGQNLDDIETPCMVLATDFSGGVSPTTHAIKVVGSINYEWETTSLAFDLRFPPSNFSRFNEAYFEAITRECPFTENPTHLQEIARKIERVMKHPLTKFVVKTIGEVGVAAVMAAV